MRTQQNIKTWGRILDCTEFVNSSKNPLENDEECFCQAPINHIQIIPIVDYSQSISSIESITMIAFNPCYIQICMPRQITNIERKMKTEGKQMEEFVEGRKNNGMKWRIFPVKICLLISKCMYPICCECAQPCFQFEIGIRRNPLVTLACVRNQCSEESQGRSFQKDIDQDSVPILCKNLIASQSSIMMLVAFQRLSLCGRNSLLEGTLVIYKWKLFFSL